MDLGWISSRACRATRSSRAGAPFAAEVLIRIERFANPETGSPCSTPTSTAGWSCSSGPSPISRSASGCGSRDVAARQALRAAGEGGERRAGRALGRRGADAYLRRVRHVGRARAEQLLHARRGRARGDRPRPGGRLPRGRAEPAARRRGGALVGRAALDPRAAPAAGAARARVAGAADRGALRRPRASRRARAAVRPHRGVRGRLPGRRHDRPRARRAADSPARARRRRARAGRGRAQRLDVPPVGELAAAAGARAAPPRRLLLEMAEAACSCWSPAPARCCGRTGRRPPSSRPSWPRGCASSRAGAPTHGPRRCGGRRRPGARAGGRRAGGDDVAAVDRHRRPRHRARRRRSG